MNKLTYRLLILTSICIKSLLCHSLTISKEDTHKIADKIWKNESNSSIDGLTSWNNGEEFASLGIGHFLWYPAGTNKKFSETFPELMTFMQSERAVIPEWLKNQESNPWHSREEFYENFKSTEMIELRQFLLNTIDLQALFITNRLEKAINQITGSLSETEKEHVLANFDQLSKDPNGLYALIDYLNFKGAGTSASETYNGEGWGLRQVLLKTSTTSSDRVVSFVETAKEVLTRRVKNSPPDRHEEKWLKGWINRVNTYLDK